MARRPFLEMRNHSVVDRLRHILGVIDAVFRDQLVLDFIRFPAGVAGNGPQTFALWLGDGHAPFRDVDFRWNIFRVVRDCWLRRGWRQYQSLIFWDVLQ